MQRAQWISHLRAYLPDHAARAAVREIEALAERLVGLQSLAELHRGDTSLLALLQLVTELYREQSAAQQRLRDSRDALAGVATEDARRSAIRDALVAANAGGLSADLAAVDRFLDAEAIELRNLYIAHPLAQQWQLAAMVAARMLAPSAAPTVERDQSAAFRTAADSAAQSAARLMRDTRQGWWSRVAACELVGALAPLSRRQGPRLRQLLLDVLQQHTDEPWVQAAALGAYIEARARADQEIAGVLADVATPAASTLEELPAEHCFVRARALEICGAHGLWFIVEQALERPDPSDHVQICAARIIARATAAELRPRLLRVVEGEGFTISPRARAAAVVASLPDDDPPPGEREALAMVAGEARPAAADWIELVATGLSPERDPWIVGVVIDALLARRQVLAREGESEAMRRAWGDALDYWRAREEPRQLGESAGKLLRWLAVQADDKRASALVTLDDWLAEAREGERRRFSDGPLALIEPRELLDVLTVAAVESFDLAAEPLRRGYRLENGSLPRFALWRLLYELRRPANDKRKAFSHTTDCWPRGSLVALTDAQSEVTPTRVPGRRVASPAGLSWGAELPLPALLLTAARHPSIEIMAARRHMTIERRRGRVGAWWAAQRRYAELARLRQQLLRRPLAEAVVEYDKALEQNGFHVVRHGGMMLPLAASLPSFEEAAYYLVSTDIGTIAHLAAVAGVLTAVWAGRAMLVRNQISRDRRSIPLVIGGWGSRGKSGTERLKAGLFHGLGYRVVAKTTGCEAMFIASIPGQEPTEIFLYRPYDKATIWEQRNILNIGVGLDAQVFLWECMALRPSFVEVLQQEWMQDDIATITNTYPDHEDIQGPAGRDVADTIGLFIPRNSLAITTEQHMTPALVQRARERNSELVVCRAEEWELLPQDVLERFPYHEHPKNIALTIHMAARLGIRADVALKEMADNVVPDIGVLKEYGPASYKGRTLSLINGSSANERAGHLSNWDRLGLGKWGETSGLGARMVLVVNNRADRLARQSVFEKIAINDMSADAVFVIGTNVGAYTDNVRKGLRTELRADLLDRFGDGKAETRRELVAHIGDRLRRPALGEQDALRVASDFVGEEGRPWLQEWAKSCYTHGARGIDELASELLVVKIEAGKEVSPLDHARQWLREVSWLHLLLEHLEGFSLPATVDAFIELYGARLHPLMDPALSGDQVFHLVAVTEPVGARTRVMSCQNIKGTGLGFVYRWVAVDKMSHWLDELPAASAAEAEALLHRIGGYSNKGVADQAIVVERLAELAKGGRLSFLGLTDLADGIVSQSRQVLEAKEQALGTGAARQSWVSRLKRRVESMFDAYDSMRRSREAKALYRDLVARRVGFLRAAMEAKKFVDRQKGGWLFKS